MAKLAKLQVEMQKSPVELHKSQAQFVIEIRTSLNNQSTKIKNLKVQVGQMATMLNERQQGFLPSTSEVNPRSEGKEHCKAITLRSGKIVENSIQVDGNDKEAENASKNSVVNEPKKDNVKAPSREDIPTILFSQCLKKNMSRPYPYLGEDRGRDTGLRLYNLLFGHW